MSRVTFETLAGSAAASAVSVPLVEASTVAAEHPSLLGITDPLRAVDAFGLPNFYDHAGNLINGDIPALAAVYIGTIACLCMDDDDMKKKVILGSSVAGASLATGVNVAYEAGAHIPPFPDTPADRPFDALDAAYGSAAGLIVAGTFAAVSLALMRRRRSRESK